MPIGDFGLIIDNVKYLSLAAPSLSLKGLKKNSLDDNVYCTLRDIFRNLEKCYLCMHVNAFSEVLTCGHHYDKKPDNYEYSDALYDKKYLENLIRWLDMLNESDLLFEKLEEENTANIDMSRYMKFDEWWADLEETKLLLKQQYAEL